MIYKTFNLKIIIFLIKNLYCYLQKKLNEQRFKIILIFETFSVNNEIKNKLQ